MAYRFRKNEAIPDATRRVFVEEIDWAVGQLAESKDRTKAVHEARKSIKKIRGLLTLFEPKSAMKDFRDAGRRLSGLRDNQVVLQVFDGLIKQHPEFDAGALRPLLERGACELPADRQACAVVIASLKKARARAHFLPVTGLDVASLLPALTATYRKGRKALQRLAKEQSAECFHDLRKSVKQHYYQLRLCEVLFDGQMQPRAKDLHKLETWLGDANNLAVLQKRLAADVETSSDRRQVRKMAALAEDAAHALRQRALQAAEQLYAAKTRDFDRKKPQPQVETPKTRFAVA